MVGQAARVRWPWCSGAKTRDCPTTSSISAGRWSRFRPSAEYTSMNLAQAIGIMSYETWRVRIGADISTKPPRRRAAPGGGRPDRVALHRLDAGALGHRLLQDPPARPRHALVSGDHLPGGARWARSVAAARDGDRGTALSGTEGCGGGGRSARPRRRPLTPANRDAGPPHHGSGSLNRSSSSTVAMLAMPPRASWEWRRRVSRGRHTPHRFPQSPCPP